MEKKRLRGGIFVMLAIFFVFIVGCNTTTPVNYYNLGDVLEDYCSFIVVSPIYIDSGTDFRVINLVKINGQGDKNQWVAPSFLINFKEPKAIVRVTPGEHTFSISFMSGTVDFYRITDGSYAQTSIDNETTVNITYNTEANKGYIFSFSAKRESEHPVSPVIITMVIYEGDIADILNYGNFSLNFDSYFRVKEVARNQLRTFVHRRENIDLYR